MIVRNDRKAPTATASGANQRSKRHAWSDAICTSAYPAHLLKWARKYALAHKLRLRAVLAAALGEYAAKRKQRPEVGPEPQLHYQRGHPSAAVEAEQQALLSASTRGRSLRRRGYARSPQQPSHVPIADIRTQQAP